LRHTIQKSISSNPAVQGLSIWFIHSIKFTSAANIISTLQFACSIRTNLLPRSASCINKVVSRFSALSNFPFARPTLSARAYYANKHARLLPLDALSPAICNDQLGNKLTLNTAVPQTTTTNCFICTSARCELPNCLFVCCEKRIAHLCARKRVELLRAHRHHVMCERPAQWIERWNFRQFLITRYDLLYELSLNMIHLKWPSKIILMKK